MTVRDALWDETEELMRQHVKANAGDQTPTDAMNRIFRERVRGSLPFRIARSSCRIRKETLAVRALRSCSFERTTDPPHSIDKPLVAVEWSGDCYLIDGRKRLNKAIRERSPSEFEVLIISPTQM
jgi:hypothetical protein